MDSGDKISIFQMMEQDNNIIFDDQDNQMILVVHLAANTSWKHLPNAEERGLSGKLARTVEGQWVMCWY